MGIAPVRASWAVGPDGCGGYWGWGRAARGGGGGTGCCSTRVGGGADQLRAWGAPGSGVHLRLLLRPRSLPDRPERVPSGPEFEPKIPTSQSCLTRDPLRAFTTAF
ncbi:hypothetical protein [Amycolatopsis thailandensis]|uniref:hypothetical protein n=1 Tax=Amycolatopsis thailandensis TaxID=589330 RepID=UPI00142D4279|nr:hypothetical protein [Amycolatopsis thailandensis]